MMPGMRARKLPPFWLEHLDLVQEEFRSTRWPKTAEEGMSLVLELSNRGWKQLMADLESEHPEAPAQRLEEIAYRLVTEWAVARRTVFSCPETTEQTHRVHGRR